MNQQAPIMYVSEVSQSDRNEYDSIRAEIEHITTYMLADPGLSHDDIDALFYGISSAAHRAMRLARSRKIQSEGEIQ